MSEQAVLYSVSNHICTVTLNQPESMNALSTAVLEGVTQALERADKDDEVRIFLLFSCYYVMIYFHIINRLGVSG